MNRGMDVVAWERTHLARRFFSPRSQEHAYRPGSARILRAGFPRSQEHAYRPGSARILRAGFSVHDRKSTLIGAPLNES